MNLEIEFKVDTAKVESALAKLGTALAGVLPEPLRVAFHRAGAIYLASMRRRYVALARGGGEWAPLALATKLARIRKNKRVAGSLKRSAKANRKLGGLGTQPEALHTLELAGSSFEILRDTGILLNSLSENGPSNVMEFVDHGIRLGTNVIYAQYHQDPTVPGRPPVRKIIVEPDPLTLTRMTHEMQVGVDAIVAQAGLAEQGLGGQ